ncbi:hypothetical protein [Loigolactobacillus binensis]|uniref:Uncharacterized protein n=1 Tax=Loigolactobacillus binensis TaxID=2559922 RepID=A0ABW3EAT9_9LACO|nr:hypothetical protein [Loigolactobacillus binensis]
MKRKLRNILQVIEEHGDSVKQLANPNILQLKFAAQPTFTDHLIIDSEVFQLLKLYAADAAVVSTAPIAEVPAFFQKMFQRTSTAAAKDFQAHVTPSSSVTVTVALTTDDQHHDLGSLSIQFWD